MPENRQWDEFSLIRNLIERVPTSGSGVLTGPGDDAAVLQTPPNFDTVVTTDTMVEGRHFLSTTMSAADIGWKAVAASLSDIAAMGGRPAQVLLALGIPVGSGTAGAAGADGARGVASDADQARSVGTGAASPHDAAFVEAIYDGVGAICRQFGCTVVGGDVVATAGPLFINTTVLGAVPSGQALLRSGATPGDIVFVTGHVGTAEAGLRDLKEPGVLGEDDRLAIRRAHQRPVPQIEAAAIFAAERIHSLNDISDGLASELNEIAAASQVRIRIEEPRIPLHPGARNLARLRRDNPLDYAWNGGEDYQLVGTAPPFAYARLLARCESIGVSVTQIGRVEPGDGVVAETADGRLEVIEPRGYRHGNL